MYLLHLFGVSGGYSRILNSKKLHMSMKCIPQAAGLLMYSATWLTSWGFEPMISGLRVQAFTFNSSNE